MNDTAKLNQAIELLKTLKQDALMAISGEWDKSNDGFNDQIDSIDTFLDFIED